MPVALRTRRFTADEYQRMGEAVDRATRLFVARAGERAIVRIQGVTRLDGYSEPQPDVLLLRPRDDFYASAHPGPADVLLVLEVADSSIDYDRDVKAYLYARSGVAEYWILDVSENVLIRHTSPAGGSYRLVEPLDSTALIAPTLLPDCTISVGELIGRT